MPASEYTTTSGGLRLKGARDAGIDKKRKKKRKAAVDEDVKTVVAVAAQEDGHVDSPTPITKDINGEDGDVVETSNTEPRRDVEETRAGKTESQLNFERMRNKRLYNREQKDGNKKTHKERVEEFNTKLSKMSEHHDMPRIGPG